MIFPAANPPIKIKPKKGMGVVWHNSDQNGVLDNVSIHGEMRFMGNEGDVKWTAKKWIYAQPLGKARTVLLPLAFFPNSGKAPHFVLQLYNYCLKEFGPDTGYERFDNAVYVAFMTVIGVLLLFIKVAVDKPSVVAPKKKKAEETGEGKKRR